MFSDSQPEWLVCSAPHTSTSPGTLRSTLFIILLALIYTPSQHFSVSAQERLVSEKYFGTAIGSLPAGQPSLGQVYAVDEFTLFIRSFSFHGDNYPLSYFLAGLTSFPDGNGFLVPDERGSTRPLGEYHEKDIVLRLPEGRSLKEIRWISVWSRQLHTNLGHVPISPSLAIPTPIELPALTGLAHGVRSGAITIADAQTLLVTDFWYDGQGPAGYWWVSRGPRPNPQGLRLKDEKGTPNPLRAYRGESVLITLPDAKTIYDFDWFGVWCEEFRVDFGHVQIPQHLRVPPSPRMLGLKPETKLNCEVLDDQRGFEARWIMDGDDIVMQLVARLQPREYMSLGLGKDDARSNMIASDAVVTWIDQAGNGHAVDYYLGSKEQCIANRGSCPDSKHPGATDSIILLHAAVINGFSMVTFKRPQLGVDEIYDQHIYSDGQQAVLWAIGPLNDRNEISYHSSHSYGNRFIDFARTPLWNCPRPDESLLNQRKWQRLITAATTSGDNTSSFERASGRITRNPTGNSSRNLSTTTTTRPKVLSITQTNLSSSASGESSAVGIEPWRIPQLKCPKERTFWAQIGPTGGARGYRAITGRQGWGIAWYINGLLIPELIIQRGVTYTFFVEGGNDELNGARRHPLYLTDSPEGGFQFKTQAERQKERIYAGVTLSPNGTIKSTTEGRLCEWKITPATNMDDMDGVYATFKQFQSTLLLDCDPKHRPGVFKFTPDRNTPDTLYYQCFTHRHLGWKIRVVDSCDQSDNRPLQASASIVSSVKTAPPGQIKNDFNRHEKNKPKTKSSAKVAVMNRGKVGKPSSAPSYHHRHPNDQTNQIHLPKQHQQSIEYEVHLPLSLPNQQSRPVFDPDNEDDLSPFGPLLNGYGEYGMQSFMPMPNRQPVPYYPQASPIRSNSNMLQTSPQTATLYLPMESVQSNVYGQPLFASNRLNMKNYGHVHSDQKRIDLGHTSGKQRQQSRPSKPKLALNYSHRLHSKLENGYSQAIHSSPSMQSGFVPIQLESTVSSTRPYGLNQSQNVWFKNEIYLPTVQRNKPDKASWSKYGDRKSGPKIVTTSTKATDPTTTTSTTTVKPSTKTEDLSKLYFIPSDSKEKPTMTTTNPVKPISNSNVWIGNEKEANALESQRLAVYVHNTIPTPKPEIYNQNVKVDAKKEESDKTLTIHSVMRNSERMAEQNNNTDHTILSDVLRLIAQDVSSHTNKLPSAGVSHRPWF